MNCVLNLLSLEDQGDISKIAVNSKILEYCRARDARNKYHSFLNANKFNSERTAKEKLKSNFWELYFQEEKLEKSVQ